MKQQSLTKGSYYWVWLLVVALVGIGHPNLNAANSRGPKKKRINQSKKQSRPTKNQIRQLRDKSDSVARSTITSKRQKHWAKKWKKELDLALSNKEPLTPSRFRDLSTKLDSYENAPSRPKNEKSALLAVALAESVSNVIKDMEGMSAAQKKRILNDIKELRKGVLNPDRVGFMIAAVDESIEANKEAKFYKSYPVNAYKKLTENIRPRNATKWVDPKFITEPQITHNSTRMKAIPTNSGATSTYELKKLTTRDLTHRLRLVEKDGKVTMPRRSIPFPWPNPKVEAGNDGAPVVNAIDPFYGHTRNKEYRKLPLVLAGFFDKVFPKTKIRENTNALLETLVPTNRGTYNLYADKVQELYPDRKDSPKGSPTHLKTYLKSIKDAKFVWAHIYQLSNPAIYKALHEKAKTGVPVYLVVGSKEDSSQALNYFRDHRSKVKVVTSAQEYQGQDREFRIDHNKSLFTINAKGISEVIEGGINGGELSSQNIDTSYKFTGGNFALDVLNNLMFHTLRAEGTIHTKDIKILSSEIGNMLSRKPTKTSVELETAVTSSRVIGRGRIMDKTEILSKLKNKKSLVLDGTSALKALEEKGSDAVFAALQGALRRGKHIIFSMDSDMSTRKKKRLKSLSKELKDDGLEIFLSSAILVDNSIKNLAHSFVEEAVENNSNIYTAAFAHSDGAFNKKLVWASKELAERGSKSQVHVTSPDLQINGVPINRNSTGSLLWAKDAGYFKGTVTGVHYVDGPQSSKTGERKWHSKLLIAEDKIMIGSANHSKIGFEASEERGVVIKDKAIAQRIIKYKNNMEKRLLKNNWAKKLELDLKRSKTKFEDRPSLTRDIPKEGSSLSDHVYIIMDLETDGLSQPTDGRITQMAAQAMEMDERGNLRNSNVGKNVSNEFNQFMSVGLDHYGRERKLDPRIKKLTDISENMLRYQPEMVDAFNRFNAWVRHVERTTGKTPILVMHNKNFDHNMYNAWAATKGVIGNPVISEKNVFCTLRGQEKFRVIRSVKEGNPISTRVKLKAAKDSWDEYNGIPITDIDGLHRADVDMGATAAVFESQVKYAMKGIRLVEEMQLRDLSWSRDKRELRWATVVNSKKKFYDWSTPRKKRLDKGTYGQFSWLFKSKKSLIEEGFGANDHGDMTDAQFQLFSRIKEVRRAWALLKAKRAAKESHKELPEQSFANQ